MHFPVSTAITVTKPFKELFPRFCHEQSQKTVNNKKSVNHSKPIYSKNNKVSYKAIKI